MKLMGVDFVSVQIIIVKTHGGFFHFSLPLGLEMWDVNYSLHMI